MGAIRKDTNDQFRIAFAELAKTRRGEPTLVDPYLIARAIAAVMRACTVRSAAGRALLWNEYRMILARADFELVRALQGHLERDLHQVLAQEAAARQAELVGALRVTVVFDEADELTAGNAVVRVGFSATEQQAPERAGEMTVRFDSWVAAGGIVAKSVSPGGTSPQAAKSVSPGGTSPQAAKSADTVIVDETAGHGVVQWSGGAAPLVIGVTRIAGRPHADAPPRFIALTGAGSKVNKQQIWIALGPTTVRIGRLASANPVHVNGQRIEPAHDVEVPLPAEVSLSHGELVLRVMRR